jgi:hypothetical protein
MVFIMTALANALLRNHALFGSHAHGAGFAIVLFPLLPASGVFEN